MYSLCTKGIATTFFIRIISQAFRRNDLYRAKTGAVRKRDERNARFGSTSSAHPAFDDDRLIGRRLAIENLSDAEGLHGTFLFRTHLREENHITDVCRIGQQHHQAVDANAAAASRRQAIFQCTNVIGVVVHGFFVTGFFGLGLRKETLCLILRIVEFRKAVGDLSTDDEQLEALGNLQVRLYNLK